MHGLQILYMLILAMGELVVAVSVGGTKVQLGIADRSQATVIASSERIEWSRDRSVGIKRLLALVASELDSLLASTSLNPKRVALIGVAWPGPGTKGNFEATFVPGCEQRQPIAAMLKEVLGRRFGSAFDDTPIKIVLDAHVRAAGETLGNGKLRAPVSGILINIATGIAGALVRDGEVLYEHEVLGETYGQFGRYLLYDRRAGSWSWVPTSDGSMPSRGRSQIRWTDLCGGPGLAKRIAAWCRKTGYRPEPATWAAAVKHPFVDSIERNPIRERALLEMVTQIASAEPTGVLSEFGDQVAREMGEAIDCLLRAFEAEPLEHVVLAGGVGENFLRPVAGKHDTWLAEIRAAICHRPISLSRARLGVKAEFLGFLRQPCPNDV